MAKRYEATRRQNGSDMVTAKVEVHFTFEDLAMHLLDDTGAYMEYEESPLAELIKDGYTTRTKIMDAVKNSVLYSGQEQAGYRVGDATSWDDINEVVNHIKEVWANG